MGPARGKLRRVIRGALGILFLAGAARGGDESAGAPAASSADLTKLSLEDLMNVEVTSVAKQKQKLADAPAAVYVITQEDIRRSGLTSIAELLRLSPGLDVARIDANKWAISSRGFNSFFANDLLVLVDGRSVYKPIFAGVLWDVVDYTLADIDRIEVIRGPGATMWGANAVNGVINIVTKSAKDTQGGLATGLIGTEEDVGSFRYGGKVDDKTYYRAYAKYYRNEGSDLADGHETQDQWNNLRGGFRLDRYASEQDLWTVQGDLYESRTSEVLSLPAWTAPFMRSVNDKFNQSGGNVLGRWTHNTGSDSELAIQAYYDHFERHDSFANYTQDVLNLDVQHRFQVDKRQQITWGAVYRYMGDQIPPSRVTVFDPEDGSVQLGSIFIQDRLAVVPNKLFLFAGSELEVNSLSGFEFQPSVRGLWTPNDRNSVWAAVSRAVRTPSRSEQESRITFAHVASGLSAPLPQVASIESVGNEDFQSEGLLAYEIGYRVKATDVSSIDLAAFANRYDHLRSFQPGAPFTEMTPAPHFVQPMDVRNLIYGESYGVEIAANWQVRDNWRLMGSYTWCDIQLHSNPSSRDQEIVDTERKVEGSTPNNQFSLRSYYDLTRNLELNAALFYVDNLSYVGVPNYLRLDLGLTWHINKNLEWSVVGQNLLDDRHPEFSAEISTVPTETERAVYTQLTWRF